MENPTLTFLTPTFIAGDRSLVGLVAHELAHSWSGNLVTNANWPDSWLNEGFTSYFENRIMEAVYGRARAAPGGGLSWADMQAALRELGPTAPRDRAPRRPSTIPTAAAAASSTTRARSSCARSSGSSGASGSTPGCAPISTATPSSR